MTFKFMCKRVYGRTLFYPVDEKGQQLLKIFRRTTIDGIQNMAILKLIIPIEIVYEEVNLDGVIDGQRLRQTDTTNL